MKHRAVSSVQPSAAQASTSGIHPRLGVALDYAGDVAAGLAEAVAYERAGAELITVSETYGVDAISQLGYLAARTTSARLSTSIIPIYTRTPALIAMTAAGLDTLSGGRFELGLGTSGPQVIEGFHGVPYAAPLGSTREVVEIVRAVWRREDVEHHGRRYDVPLSPEKALAQGGTGLGKPLHLISHPVRERIPIHLASLTAKAVAQAAEIAEGWEPFLFHPERADRVWGAALREGLERRDPALGPLDVIVPAPLYIGRHARFVLGEYKKTIALYVGGMGARGRNFYNDVFAGYGYADEAVRIQELYLSGDKAAAAAVVPDEFARAASLIGDRDEVAERVEAFVAAGATTLAARPLGRDAGERVAALTGLRSLLDARG